MQSLGIFSALMLTCYALLVSWRHCWRVKLSECLTPFWYNISANFYPLKTCKEGKKSRWITCTWIKRSLPIYLWDWRHFLYTFVQRSQALLDGCERHAPMVEDIYVLCLADNALGPCVAGKDEGGPGSNGELGSPICSAKKWALWFQ